MDYDPNSGSNTTLATFAYDALGRKITAWTQYDGTNDNQTQDLRFYHDGQVEIADYDANGALSRRFVNGTQYIDERAVLIEGEAASADTFYYLLQELDTVTGLIEKNGALAEADVYDGYGKVNIWDYSAGDFDRDGDVDATDQTTFNAALLAGGANKSTSDPMSDLDNDGDTDLTDAAAFTVIKNAGGAVAQRYVSSLGNPFFFTGRRLYMLETLPEGASVIQANQQLQHNRARHYAPLEGRWLQRDPSEYLLGASLYEYAISSPAKFLDSTGFVIEELPSPPNQQDPNNPRYGRSLIDEMCPAEDGWEVEGGRNQKYNETEFGQPYSSKQLANGQFEGYQVRTFWVKLPGGTGAEPCTKRELSFRRITRF